MASHRGAPRCWTGFAHGALAAGYHAIVGDSRAFLHHSAPSTVYWREKAPEIPRVGDMWGGIDGDSELGKPNCFSSTDLVY
jgi:hypothetical protein